MVFLFINPSITGFAIAEKKLNTEIVVNTHDGKYLPMDSIVVVHLDDQKKNMKIGDFIEKTKQDFKLDELGYTGDKVYKLDISEFEFDKIQRGEHAIKIEITYNDAVLSSDEKLITF